MDFLVVFLYFPPFLPGRLYVVTCCHIYSPPPVPNITLQP